MQVALDTELIELFAQRVNLRFTLIAGDNDTGDGNRDLRELAKKAKHVLPIGAANVGANLARGNVAGGHGDNDLAVVRDGLKGADFYIRLKAGEHAAGMVIVEQLAAELQVELAAEHPDALLDVL